MINNETKSIIYTYFLKRKKRAMKNKRLVVILSILAFLTVLVVLNSTVFTLQKVSVNWLTTRNELVGKDDSIVSSVSTGVNIFLVDKNKISEDLEKKNPYLRVVGIETKFPNKIVIHTAERESLYAVELSENGASYYMILDEKGKALRRTNSSIFAVGAGLGARPIRISFEGVGVDANNYVEGENIKDEELRGMLSNLSYTLREAGHTPTTSKGLFSRISIVYAGGEKEIILTTRNGMKICLKDAENLTTDKLLLGLSVYDDNQQNGVVDGTITVWYSEKENKVMAVYSDKND